MNKTTDMSYIILPDTPGFITVTESQLDKLIKANLLKQIGTFFDGRNYSLVRSLVQPPRDQYGRRAARGIQMYRCYLVD